MSHSSDPSPAPEPGSPAPPSPDPGDPAAAAPAAPSYWLWIVCLLGVDYFSTLAYQPSISFQVAGRLAPLATVVVVLVTLLCALPVYFYVAGRSPHGQGSIALLEQLVHGWRGKTLILGLLGFAATDFVMIKTLSLADAAVHVRQNTYIWEEKHLHNAAKWVQDAGKDLVGDKVANYFDDQLIVTIVLGVLGFLFWFLLRKGFNRNILFLAVPVVGAYLLLNAIILGHGVAHLIDHPERVADWWAKVESGDWVVRDVNPGPASWGILVLLCLVFLPWLALGLSGFELSLIVMPQVKGPPGDDPVRPRGRVRNTRKVLVVAALIMSVYLLASVFVTTVLIPPEAMERSPPAAQKKDGAAKLDPQGKDNKARPDYANKADNRALAYLAHNGTLVGGGKLGGIFGPAFGTVYDIVTVLLLCLAGTSIMTALSVLLPQFLLRFGMELKWAHKWGLLLGLFALVNLIVTIWFRADVHDQRGAYATGVTVLLTSAALVSYLSIRASRKEQKKRPPWLFGLITLIFAGTTVVVIVTSPSGLLISFAFIVTVLTTSVFARAIRCDELRTLGFDFADPQSKFLWDSLLYMDFPALVPHRPGLHVREEKEQTIRRDHQLDPNVDIVFLEIEVDDPSNFYQRLLVQVFQEEKRFVIKLTRCVSVAHAVAAVALEMSKHSKPPAVHFGWSEIDLLAASWSYLAFGEGNIPWKVRELIMEAQPERERQPRVIIG